LQRVELCFFTKYSFAWLEIQPVLIELELTNVSAASAQPINRKSIVTGDILVLCAMSLFGTYALFLRMQPQIPVLIFLRSFQIVGALVFGICYAVCGITRLGKKAILLLVLLALVASAQDLVYFCAFRLTTVANAAIAHQMVSVFLLILAPWLLQERTRRSEWIALAFSLCGLVILYSGHTISVNTKDSAGISLSLLSAFLYAMLIVLFRHINRLGLSIVTLSFWRYFLSTLLLVPIVFTSIHWTPHGPDLLWLGLFGVLFAVIGTWLHILGINQTRALHVSILGKSEPVFAALYAFIFLKEWLTINEILGGLLIIGSSIFLAFLSESALQVDAPD
jgi:drug/metabolite transporter (DMT)-like permease